MTLIIGFDPSKSTGWSLLDTGKDFSAIECGVLEMPDKSDHYYTADQIGLKVSAMLRQCKEQRGKLPDFAVLEQQIEAQASMAGRGQSFAGSIYPWIATSAIVATLANFKIAYGTLMPSSWRKSFFGQGFKPPLDKKGKKDWKQAAITECERLGINLPSRKALADDAAEAAALAICWASRDINLHARRYEEPLMKLLQQRNSKAPEGVAA
jgi:Holliday junction resolvasome RuvABC endonuclease subunit